MRDAEDKVDSKFCPHERLCTDTVINLTWMKIKVHLRIISYLRVVASASRSWAQAHKMRNVAIYWL